MSKIKKRKPRPAQARSGAQRTPAWLVPFNEAGNAGVYIHKHGTSNDHSACGPVVMCCERAAPAYAALAPDLHQHVASYQMQRADHLCTWLDGGVQAMYFVLCDPDDAHAIYQFGLPEPAARELLLGKVPHSAYRLADRRYRADDLADVPALRQSSDA
ncbi:MAG: hypothetical protein KC620_05880 [Myxococcales bacterium]|nr:hypothetical protein [Myxococcales bacterium]